jgi:hypothetical protein
MVHKIMHGESGLQSNTWFKSASGTAHATRSGADPLNIKCKTGRLELRRNFFSVRVISDWNRIQAEIEMKQSAKSFKAAYKSLRESPTHPAEYDRRLETDESEGRPWSPTSSLVIQPGSWRTSHQVPVSK